MFAIVIVVSTVFPTLVRTVLLALYSYTNLILDITASILLHRMRGK